MNTNKFYTKYIAIVHKIFNFQMVLHKYIPDQNILVQKQKHPIDYLK